MADTRTPLRGECDGSSADNLDVEPSESSDSCGTVHRPKERTWAWILGPLVGGLIVGLALPLDVKAGQSSSWARLSSMIGWSYFFAWSVSFYPQLVLNCKRRSVVGLSLDFQLLNITGFTCYFIFNAAMYWNEQVKEEYREKHHGNSSAVKLNDVVFAGHAMLVTAATLIQIMIFYDQPPLDRPDRLLRYAVSTGLGLVILGSVVLALIIAASYEKVGTTWLTYLNLLAEVKVIITLTKYCPQVLMNCRRRSTDGWSINNVLLDLTGSIMSVVQLLLDAWSSEDWTAVTGNPAKFLLGNVSFFFDAIFIIQHYCLYRRSTDHEQDDCESNVH